MTVKQVSRATFYNRSNKSRTGGLLASNDDENAATCCEAASYAYQMKGGPFASTAPPYGGSGAADRGVAQSSLESQGQNVKI